jgi:SAM-dependent methyltransferase
MNSGHIDSANSWDLEYLDRGIPSSWKDEPSNVVIWGVSNLNWLGISLGDQDQVLDVGCGSGRNSVALAQRNRCHAIGLDCSRKAISSAWARLAASDQTTRSLVTFLHRDIRERLPLADGCATLCIDIFVYFHLLDAVDRARYRLELKRVLRKGGALLLSLATVEDGYYADCPEQPDFSLRSGAPVVLDERVGVGNIMHSLESLSVEFSDTFKLRMAWDKITVGPMHGRLYRRATLATLWQCRDT